MFAVLDFSDFAIIAFFIIALGGSSAAWAYSKPSDANRLFRLERKVDLILKHLGIEYTDPALSEEVRRLAVAVGKIQAIKLHREQTGLGLKEAKDAVEAYLKELP